MPTIHVSKNFKFAERGHSIREFLAGESYEVSDEIAKLAASHGWAGKEVASPSPVVTDSDPGDGTEVKAIEHAPLNKMRGRPRTKKED